MPPNDLTSRTGIVPPRRTRSATLPNTQRPMPERRNRTNPRVVKQKMSSFRVKRPCHLLWPQPTKPFRNAIVLLK